MLRPYFFSKPYIGSIDLCVLCVWCGSLYSLASRTVSQNTFCPPNPKESMIFIGLDLKLVVVIHDTDDSPESGDFWG
jgi:hypothetical protein